MNELELQRVYNYSSYPRVSKRFSDKVFVSFDDGERSGSHWTGVLKISHSTLVRLLDNPVIFYLNNDPNQSYIIIIKYKRLILKLCGTFCLYFFLIERMNYYVDFLKMSFGYLIIYADKSIWQQLQYF